jgi:predicted RND superfamily exporter protein
MIINILIIFFTILILYQVFLLQLKYNFNNYIIEGMDTSSSSSSKDYQPYDTNNQNNSLILAQQNAGNIEVLKQQMDKVLGLSNQVRDISGNVATLTEQVTTLMLQQQKKAESKLSDSPPEITGAT